MKTMLAPVAVLSLGLAFVACTSPGTGEPEPAQPPAQTSIRAVSYNIRHGAGLDGQLDLERTAGVLAALEPDVVLLQEVDEVCARSGNVDQARWLGQRLGMHARFAPFMDYDGGRYGLAILSRYPVLDSHVISLPPGLHEPRSALVVTLSVRGARLQVADAHLDWLADSSRRLAQARTLRERLVQPWTTGELGIVPPLLLGGDLNDSPGSPTLAVFQEARTDGAPSFERLGPDAHTFPADAPTRTIDHFLVCPTGDATVDVLRVVEETVASDHRPVVIDFRW